MKRLLGIVILTFALSCTDESAGPPAPPDPPDGLVPGTAAWTHEKDGQPATRVSESGLARFEPSCMTYIALGNDPFIEFILGLDGRAQQRTYAIGNAPDPSNYVAAVGSTHIYAFTTPPVPITGELSILYVSSTRIDGRFTFRGGADSAGVVFTILVQGSFSATPLPPSYACP